MRLQNSPYHARLCRACRPAKVAVDWLLVAAAVCVALLLATYFSASALLAEGRHSQRYIGQNTGAQAAIFLALLFFFLMKRFRVPIHRQVEARVKASDAVKFGVGACAVLLFAAALLIFFSATCVALTNNLGGLDLPVRPQSDSESTP